LYARLEQLVKTEQDEFFSLIETQSTRIDYYKTLVTALYTGPIKKKFNPIGTFSDFEIGSKNNIFHDINVSDMLKEQNNPWKLQERFDFSNHNNSGPHINYSFNLPGVYHEGSQKDPLTKKKKFNTLGGHFSSIWKE